MPRFSRLTPQTAVGASRELLGELVERHGTVGDMVATMAHSPAVLGGYLHLGRALRRAKLDRRTSELISIAVRAQQDCGMCLASHVEAARSLGVPEEEIQWRTTAPPPTRPSPPSSGSGSASTARLLPSPTNRSTSSAPSATATRAIADVVGVVSLNIITGAFNLVAGLTPGADG